MGYDDIVEPAELFRQFNDNGMQVAKEITRRRDLDQKALEALGHSFFAITQADLRKNTFQIVRATDYSRRMLESCENTEQAFDAFIQTLVEPEFHERMYEFCNTETIAERLRGEKQISCEYLSVVVKGWCRTTFYPLDWDENGEVIEFLFAVGQMGEVEAHELEASIASRRNVEIALEKQLNGLIASNENTISVSTINLTNNTYEPLDDAGFLKQFIQGIDNYDDLITHVSHNIIGEESRAKYIKTLCRESLLQKADNGNMHVQYECLLRFDDEHYEWLITVVDMLKNPINGEIFGVAYCQSVQSSRMEKALLKKAMEQDFLFAATIFKDTDEFYLYNSKLGYFTEKMHNYWDVALADATPNCNLDTLKRLREIFTKENIIRKLDAGQEYSFSYNSVNGDKRLEIRFAYLDDEQSMILASMRDVTDGVLMEQFRHDSEHDSLTDLYNRKTVFRKINELLDSRSDEQFVMLHINVKRFRMYNTFFGDAAGDQLLCDIADLLRKVEQDYDDFIYGRIETDVFCAVFKYEQHLYQNQILMILEYFKNYRDDYYIEPNIGMYFITDRSMPVEAMFTRATLAARDLKATTQYRTVVYNETLEKELNERQQILNEMKTAIEEGQFHVYLQPKYSLRTNRMVGAEALVRWLHPTKGIISPGTFIPVFESNGFIQTLDQYMWEHVCMLLHKWKEEGRHLVPVSVNVSRVSMFGASTVDFLKSLILKYEIDPKYLELELTESAYIDNPTEMKNQMLALQAAGFRILLDDFGSGYSCLNALRELPVDVLKMDMKFMSVDSKDIRGGLVVSSIIRMAKLMKLLVVAEGVETQEQADYLKGVGCEHVQGFLFSRPVPVADFEKMLASGSKSVEYVNLPVIEHIGRILAETDSATYAMGMVIPIPLACVEYVNQKFFFSRVNPAFFTEFDASEDVEAMSEVFEKHLTKQSYEDLRSAFDSSMQSGAKVRVPVVWNADDGTVRKYICSVMYEGNIGTTATLVITFVNVTDMLGADIDETRHNHSPEIETRLWNQVKNLVAANDITAVTNSILQEMMKYYEADRAYIFEFDWEKNIGINTYEKCAADVEPMIDELQEVPVEAMDVWINLFNRRSLIHIKDVDALIGDESRKEEYEILAPQGIQSLIAAPVYSEKKLIGFLGVDNPKHNLDDTSVIEGLAFFCVNEAMREKEKVDLEMQSMQDPLTGAYNRKAWEQEQKKLLESQTPFSLVMIDVDDYKQVNDRFGHDVGDELLKRIVSELKGVFRADDMVIRYGGDEFLLVLENTASWMSGVLTEKIERLNRILSEPTDRVPGVSISAGLAFSDDCDAEDLFRNADSALYHVKNTGKNGWHVYRAASTRLHCNR